jgi:NADH:ubiquinone oxidoreductase subunit E
MTNKTYFQMEGEFLGVCALDGYKLKYMWLRTADSPQERLCQRDFLVKIPKELRGGMVYRLSIGDRIRCEVIQKDLKLKAYSIEKVDRADKSIQLAQVIKYPAHKSKVKILICQKSHCLNSGGRELYAALTEQLDSHSLNDSVTLQSTGCLKCCKQAPNIVVLPDRSSYHNVRTSQVSAIISKVSSHLLAE